MAYSPRAVRRSSLRVPATRPPLRRFFWTLGQLESGRPLKAVDLARQFEVGLRTAYRDLDFLRDEWRVPVEYDRRRGSYVLTGPTYGLPRVTLTEGELLGLFFAERVVRQYRGTTYEADLVSALRKILEFLPEQVRVAPGPLDAFLSLELGPIAAPDAEVFRQVVEALTRRRRALVRYASASSGGTADRKVDPYRLYNLRGDWYLAAHDHRRGEVRDFALHRIRRVTVLDEPYTINPNFDFRKYMADAFSIEKGSRAVTVAIRFGPRQARWIRERKWHPSARIQDRLDGGCVLRMRLAGLGEVKRWVMQFGSEAEVLAPASLRREVARELAAAGRLYSGEERTKHMRRP